MLLRTKFNGYDLDGIRRYYKGGKSKKVSTPAPLPPVTPAPQEDPVVVEENDEVKSKKKKKTGTKSLRIDRTVSSQTSGNGLNIPS